MAKRIKQKQKASDLPHWKARALRSPGRSASGQVRFNLPTSLIESFVPWVCEHKNLRGYYGIATKGSTFENIEPRSVAIRDDADFELRWAGSILAEHAHDISVYSKLTMSFERALLSSNIDECLTILSELDKTAGPTIWSVSNRIALLQLTEGLEAQKRFSKDVIAQCSPDGAIAFIFHYLSIRNENSVSPSRFVQLLDNNLFSFEAPKYLSSFVKNYVIPRTGLLDDEISAILALSGATSVLDLYETLIQIAYDLVSTESIHLYGAMSHVLHNLKRLVSEDFRLDCLIFALKPDGNYMPPASLPIHHARDLFLTGRNEEAANIAWTGLAADPTSFAFWEILALAWTVGFKNKALNERVEEPSVKKIDHRSPYYLHIITVMHRWMSGGKLDSDEISSDLMKLTLNFTTHSWARCLNGFIWRVTSNSPLPFLDNRIRKGAFASTSLDPNVAHIMPLERVRERYMGILLDTYTDSFSVGLARALVTGDLEQLKPDALTQEEFALASSEINMLNEAYEDCVKDAQLLCDSSIPHYSAIGARLKANALLYSESTAEVIEFVSKELVRNPELECLVPIEAIVDQLDIASNTKLKREIYSPIVLSLYSTYVNEDKDHLRNYAYEDFLTERGLRRPSELKDHIHEFDKPCLIYFLQKVATEGVMDLSLEFPSSRDVAVERLTVCKLLSELDVEHIEVYQAEIKDINRRLMLLERMREIEQSKIYVDTDGVKSRVSAKIRDNFNRYLSLIAINDIESRVREITKKYSEILNDKSGQQVFIFHLPDDESYQIFESMFIEIRDEFVSSTEHGLDAYLSVRIRHGTLRGQLRSPLETFHLITQRDANSDHYKDNEYWESRFGSDISNLQFLLELNSQLAIFSARFDGLVSEIISDWIQVKTDPIDKGLFDFIFTSGDLRNLVRSVSIDTSFETFVELAIARLEDRLSESLSIIRDRFGNECKSRVNELLSNLQVDVERLGNTYHISVADITYEIANARTEITTVINRIMEWFALATTTAKEPFPVEDAIGIGQASVNTFVPSFTVEQNIPDGLPLLNGDMLTGLVDVLFIVFDNIVKHSGMNEESSAIIDVDLQGDLLRIRIENSVADGIFTQSLIVKLQSIRDRIDAGQYMKAIRSEGGTGFFKIMKILKHDLNITPSIQFDFSKPDRFVFEMRIPVQSSAI